jgi:hypothetical protein
MVEPQLLSRINIVTGTSDDGIPADFYFQCLVADEQSIDNLADWIAAFFEKRIQ